MIFLFKCNNLTHRFRLWSWFITKKRCNCSVDNLNWMYCFTFSMMIGFNVLVEAIKTWYFKTLAALHLSAVISANTAFSFSFTITTDETKAIIFITIWHLESSRAVGVNIFAIFIPIPNLIPKYFFPDYHLAHFVL